MMEIVHIDTTTIHPRHIPDDLFDRRGHLTFPEFISHCSSFLQYSCSRIIHFFSQLVTTWGGESELTGLYSPRRNGFTDIYIL